jgi:RNA polymerase sigma factor (sigma-70 family)
MALHNGAMSEVTQILAQIDSGDPAAAEQLLPLVYDELRRLARAKLGHEKPGQTLQATALVHEAYLRLVGKQGPGASGQEPAEPNLAPGSRPLAPGSFSSRGHFFAAAAEAMRRILVESARRKQRLKRGGGREREPLEEDQIAAPSVDGDLIELDAALEKLQQKDSRKAELIKLRYFAGLTQQQAAEALGISVATADRDWAYARAWLLREMGAGKG